MAIGNDDNDVSDDESSASIQELIKKFRTQMVAIKNLTSNNKDLKENMAK